MIRFFDRQALMDRQPRTSEYRPTVFSFGWRFGIDGFIPWHIDYIEWMRRDPKIKLGLAMLGGPLASAKWKIEAKDERIQKFVDSIIRDCWENHLGKLLRILERGEICAEPIYREQGGLIILDGLKEILPRDASPLTLSGELVGVRVRQPKIDLLEAGKWLWIARNPQPGQWYGESAIRGAFEPWLEKRAPHGAIDIRRQWFFKNAYGGGMLRYPPGTVTDESGATVDNEDKAREILEKKMTGGTLALPNSKLPDQNDFEWIYEPPVSYGDVAGIREYTKDLDLEILEGLEIPPEVIQSSQGGGSGYAGRSVPAQAFYLRLDLTVKSLVSGISDQIVRPLVIANYGDHPFKVVTVPLLESLAEQAEKSQNPLGGPTRLSRKQYHENLRHFGRKVYLKDNDNPPEGVEVQIGPFGGRYYDSGQVTRKPPEQKSVAGRLGAAVSKKMASRNKPNPGLPSTTSDYLSDEKKATAGAYYSGKYYVPINQFLRTGTTDGLKIAGRSLTPAEKDMVVEMAADLEDAIARTPLLPEPVKVMRGDRFPGDRIESLLKALKPGAIINLGGFTSATTSEHVARTVFAKAGSNRQDSKVPILWEIEARHMIDLKPVSFYDFEHEVLMPPNQDFEVVSSRKENDLWIIKVKQVIEENEAA